MSDETLVADKKALSIAEAASRLSCSGKMVRAALASGSLRCVRLGARVIIPATEIDRFLADSLSAWSPAAIGRGSRK